MDQLARVNILRVPKDYEALPNDREYTVIELFERSVARHPDKLAVTSLNGNLTFASLDEISSTVAAHIVDRIDQEGSPIAILLDHSWKAIVALLAVLRSGHPYIGLDPTFQSERIKGILDESRASLLITQAHYQYLTQGMQGGRILLWEDLDLGIKRPHPGRSIDVNDPIWIRFTSGSTGDAKGIISSQKMVLSDTYHEVDLWKIAPSDKISLFSRLSFGASRSPIYDGLLSGATICMYDLGAQQSDIRPWRWVRDQGITIYRSTEPLFQSIFSEIEDGVILPDIRVIGMGGQAVTADDVHLGRAHTEPDCVFTNFYGITEVGSVSAYPILSDDPLADGPLPVGFPYQNKEMLLLDEMGNEVGSGETGEIVIRSKLLTDGYLNNLALSREKFRPDPQEHGIHLFHSNDLGRRNHEGAVIHLGRKDNTVKIRGYRVQLELLDDTIRAHSSVQNGITVVRRSPKRGDYLATYIVPESDGIFSQSLLRAHLLETLPEYMVPSVFEILTGFPLTSTGKIDKGALPEPSNNRPQLDTAFTPPDTDESRRIAQIWKDLLEVEEVGVHDSFFELGGDSLLALQMTIEVEQFIGQSFPRDFYSAPTINHLCELLNTSEDESQAARVYEQRVQSSKVRKKKQGAIRVRRLRKKLRQPISVDRAWKWLDKILGLSIARFIVRQDYLAAIQWGVRWSQSAWVHRFLYPKRLKRFREMRQELGLSEEGSFVDFQKSIQSNLFFGLERYIGQKKKSELPVTKRYQNSKYRFWKTLGELLESTPKGETNEWFPIRNIDKFESAFVRGNGVITLSFHGIRPPGGHFSLENRFDLPPMETISFRVPLRKSNNSEGLGREKALLAIALNADYATYTQEKLKAGQVVNIIADSSDEHGSTYQIEICGRAYETKIGFAELSVNTGAAILPYYRHYLPDGRVEVVFCDEFIAHGSSRHERVMSLVRQYVDFVETTWRQNPGILKWSRIERHLKLPKA